MYTLCIKLETPAFVFLSNFLFKFGEWSHPMAIMFLGKKCIKLRLTCKSNVLNGTGQQVRKIVSSTCRFRFEVFPQGKPILYDPYVKELTTNCLTLIFIWYSLTLSVKGPGPFSSLKLPNQTLYQELSFCRDGVPGALAIFELVSQILLCLTVDYFIILATQFTIQIHFGC